MTTKTEVIDSYTHKRGAARCPRVVMEALDNMMVDGNGHIVNMAIHLLFGEFPQLTPNEITVMIHAHIDQTIRDLTKIRSL